MKLKATLAAMAMVLPMVLAPAADARNWRANQVRIEQSGTNNGAAATQSGRANGTVIVQEGRDNLTQATQTGNNNNLCLHQVGNGLGAEVTQTGNQSGAYLQTSQGVMRFPGFRCR